MTASTGPVTVYFSEQHRRSRHADYVATAAIQEAWQWLTERTGIGPKRETHLDEALRLLVEAERAVIERLGVRP